jgi:hypothetical protein
MCEAIDLGCRWPRTHTDHEAWVRERWTGRCDCDHESLDHGGLSPHRCRFCCCVSFYPAGRDVPPSRAAVIASQS